MTPNADRIVAVAYGGDMYMSTDRGVTWTQVTSTTAGVTLTGREWESVTISHDGSRMAANIINGPIYLYHRTAAGVTWTIASDTAGGAPLVREWRSIDSSSDGRVIVAVTQRGEVWLGDAQTGVFTLVPVVVDGTPVTDGWYRVAMSENGNVIAVAGNTQFTNGGTSTGLYVSRNRGATWSRGSSVTGDYTSVTMNATGSSIGATISGPGTNGRVLHSANGGTSFAPLSPPGSDTTWRAMAFSSDGTSYTLAAGTFFGNPGQLYTSVGHRTSFGAEGYIGSSGSGQNQGVEVEYIGNNRWTVRSHQSSTIFVVQ